MLDDPQLTVRLPDGRIKDPVRVILDAEDYLDESRTVFHVDSQAPTWVVVPTTGPLPVLPRRSMCLPATMGWTWSG